MCVFAAFLYQQLTKLTKFKKKQTSSISQISSLHRKTNKMSILHICAGGISRSFFTKHQMVPSDGDSHRQRRYTPDAKALCIVFELAHQSSHPPLFDGISLAGTQLMIPKQQHFTWKGWNLLEKQSFHRYTPFIQLQHKMRDLSTRHVQSHETREPS